MAVLSEHGLYFFLNRSDKPKALPFQKQVAGEILPSIRKTGRYVHPQADAPRTAPEFLTNQDMANLSRLVWLMTHGFRRDKAFSQALYHRLRQRTGCASPSRFEVAHLPILAEELRTLAIPLMRLRDLLREAEATLVKRLIRQGEDADAVLADIEALLKPDEDGDLERAAGELSTWMGREIQDFTRRKSLPHQPATETLQ